MFNLPDLAGRGFFCVHTANDLQYGKMGVNRKDVLMKPGIKTSEFWLTVVNGIFWSLVAFGVIGESDAEQLQSLIVPVVAAVVPLVVYVIGRVAVKSKNPVTNPRGE